MMTIKEIAKITGISTRTLRYYDEIGLLKPAKRNETGYRLYDKETLERLREVLFFREFDIPLKEIRSVIDNPALDKNQILEVQKGMLIAKKERIKRLIKNIDEILKGDKTMDFEVFSKAEIEEVFDSVISRLQEEQKKVLEEKFGDMEGFRVHFMENAASEQTQKNWQKIISWYGDKDNALEAAKNPVSEDVMHAFRLRQKAAMQKLAERKYKGYAANSFEIKEIIGEYGFIQKQLFQIEYEKDLMLQLAKVYQNNEQIRKECEKQYGKGMADFFSEAVQIFYS